MTRPHRGKSNATAVDAAPGVIRAIWDLHERADQWPTVGEIVDYLRLDKDAVDDALKRLKDQRIMTTRTRNKRRVWMPWNQG